MLRMFSYFVNRQELTENDTLVYNEFSLIPKGIEYEGGNENELSKMRK